MLPAVVEALAASLPLVSILGIIRLRNNTGDRVRLSTRMEATFWSVLPSLPMFLLFPWLFRHGTGFWPALTVGIVTTIALYGLTIWLAGRFGVRL